MESNQITRLFLVGVVGLVGLFVLFQFGKFIIGGVFDAGNGTAQENTTSSINELANSSSVTSIVIKGPIIGNEEYREVKITVSSTQRTFEIIQGYEGKVIERKTYPNNTNAYSQFLSALDLNEFMVENSNQPETSDGACPQGFRYDYKVTENGQTKLDTWFAQCQKRIGTFGGNGSTVNRLFTVQIPKYSELTEDLHYGFRP